MSILTYNPKAKPGDADYWGDVYGDNSTNNQFPIGNWQAGAQSGDLGNAKYYTVVNKQNGEIAVVKYIPGRGDDVTIGTIDPKDGNNFTATKDASTAENQYFEHPANASSTKDHAMRIAQNAYDNLDAPQQAALIPPYNLLNDENPGTANWEVNTNNEGVTGVSNSVAPQNNQSGNSGNYRSSGKSGGGTGYMVFPSGADSSGQDLIKFSATMQTGSVVEDLSDASTTVDTAFAASENYFMSNWADVAYRKIYGVDDLVMSTFTLTLENPATFSGITSLS